MPDAVPRVVIVGGGFGGLAAAKALRGTNAQVILIDRQNHHLFQPLLYQVATSVLTPGQIASPIRQILRKLAWAAVHLEFLAQSSLRVSVLVQWAWTYLTGQRGSRLIVNHHASVRDDTHSVASDHQSMRAR
jgi:NADH dehydrogenase FAD-containing subunit